MLLRYHASSGANAFPKSLRTVTLFFARIRDKSERCCAGEKNSNGLIAFAPLIASIYTSGHTSRNTTPSIQSCKVARAGCIGIGANILEWGEDLEMSEI